MDNNILLINLLAKSLIQDGIRIISVTDVENAVKILKERIFDAVLFDGPNGDYSKEAILELFDKNGYLQDQRVVLFSGVTQSSFIEKWKTKGLYAHIEKPTPTQKILEFLQVVKNDPRPKKILNSQTTQKQEIVKGNNETTMIVEDEATPEQLAKVEELTKQIDELELQPAEPTSSEKTMQESESVSKQDETTMIVEDEATPEQLAKVEELTKQIDELEKNYNSKVPENIKQHHIENNSDTSKKQSPQTISEAYSDSEFKNILSRLSSIKNQFLYNTSNVNNMSQIQITEEELFNLKKEISKVRRKVYRTRPKQKNKKSTSSQKKKDKKQRTSKKMRK
ncbi:MAG: hypothetical protein OEW86_04960 [Nitrosopumilus sp.]|nr:hypothetical protein [Nitrosopumilus sp.]